MTVETFLALLPAQVGVYALVMCRVSAAVMLVPGLGEQEIPMTIRAGVAFCLTLVVAPVVSAYFQSFGDVSAAAPFALAGLVVSELLAGGLIGFVARIMTQSLPIAAQIIATFIGQSSVLQPDPDMGSQSTALSRLASLSVPVLVLGTGLYRLPLMALVQSYGVFPPGHPLGAGDVAHTIVIAASGAFRFAAELAGPFIVLGTLWQGLLALLSRFVPALQAYSLAMPAQVLGGLAVFALLIRGLLSTWIAEMTRVFALLPGF